MNLRSHHVTQGVERVPHRSLLRATGLTEEEMNRPLIGVVSAYSEIIPGHINLDKIANAVKTGVSMAGGTRKKQEDRSVRLLFKDGKAVSRILMMIRS